MVVNSNGSRAFPIPKWEIRISSEALLQSMWSAVPSATKFGEFSHSLGHKRTWQAALSRLKYVLLEFALKFDVRRRKHPVTIMPHNSRGLTGHRDVPCRKVPLHWARLHLPAPEIALTADQISQSRNFGLLSRLNQATDISQSQLPVLS